MNDMTEAPARGTNPIAVFRTQLDQMNDQFKAALPAHIPVERFMRVVMTAIQQPPALLGWERRSLWNAAITAAQDGLLPDGREAAMVIYKDKERGPIVQYMPMIAGLRKKVRNSGEIATWDVYVVHENDEFDYELGDNPFIRHKPTLDDPGRVVAAYSVCTLKTGEKSREVMSVAAIEKVRAVSRAKDSQYGPWVRWYEEMCRKTVARRHSKVLPMSTDLDDLIRQDEALYDFAGAKEEATADRPRSLAGRLDMLASAAAPAPAEDAGAADGDTAAEEEPADAPRPAKKRAAKAKAADPAIDDESHGEAGASVGLTGSEEKPAADAQRAGDDAGGSGSPETVKPGPAVSHPSSHETQAAPSLTVAEKAQLRNYSKKLENALTPTKLQKVSSDFWPEAPEEGTALGAAVDAIFSAHVRRVNGDGSLADCDDITRRLTA